MKNTTCKQLFQQDIPAASVDHYRFWKGFVVTIDEKLRDHSLSLLSTKSKMQSQLPQKQWQWAKQIQHAYSTPAQKYALKSVLTCV